MTFTNTNYQQKHELQQESLYGKTLRLVAKKTLSTKEISLVLGQKSISGHLKKILAKLRKDNLIEWTEPDTEQSSKLQYLLTQRGFVFIKLLNELAK